MKSKELIIIAIASICCIMALFINNDVNQSLTALEMASSVVREDITILQKQQKQTRLEFKTIRFEELTDIRLTSYYRGDKYDSADTTASGLSISDFEVNDLGIYTYNDRLVIATANDNYQSDLLPNGFASYKLFDELNVIIDDTSYPAIVLDICGACYWSEDVQRYDLFVKDEESVIDQDGFVY